MGDSLHSDGKNELVTGYVPCEYCCGISRRIGSLETCLAAVGIGRNSNSQVKHDYEPPDRT